MVDEGKGGVSGRGVSMTEGTKAELERTVDGFGEDQLVFQ